MLMRHNQQHTVQQRQEPGSEMMRGHIKILSYRAGRRQ
jgi:hypothetical protein